MVFGSGFRVLQEGMSNIGAEGFCYFLGLGFRVLLCFGLGFRVLLFFGLGFRVLLFFGGLGLRVEGLPFAWFRV